MNIKILINEKISKYYFLYQLITCIDSNGVFDLEKYKYKFNPYSESFLDKLSLFFKSNKNYSDNLKKLASNNKIEYLIDLIKTKGLIMRELEEIYNSEFDKQKSKLLKQKNSIEPQLDETKSFLKNVLKLFAVDENNLDTIKIFLNIGGHKEFVSGIALPSNLIVNTIFINCEKTEDPKYIKDTIIHEISHLIENFSKKTDIAKDVFKKNNDLINKYKPNQNWKAFVNEIIITTIAGKKFSIYLNQNYIPTQIKEEKDLINIIAYNSKQLISDYLKENKQLDEIFYTKLFNIIREQLNLM